MNVLWFYNHTFFKRTHKLVGVDPVTETYHHLMYYMLCISMRLTHDAQGNCHNIVTLKLWI